MKKWLKNKKNKRRTRCWNSRRRYGYCNSTGHKEVVDVEIKEEAVDPEDVEMLQDLVLAATNEAMNKADELTQQQV